MRSERVEEYLEAIARRQKTEMPVSTSSLAADLGVSLPAVTDMIQRMKAKGLINHEPNRGVSLTAEGSRIGLTTIRRHRLWEKFLTDILGLGWDKVHDTACRLEHATSPEMEERLASLLSYTDTCPHGHPIPDKDGHINKDQNVKPLSEFAVGQSVYISAVAKEEDSLLKRLEQWGLKPKSIVQIVNKDGNGSLELKLDGKTLRLDKETADYLMATSVSTGEETAGEEVPVSMLRTGESGILKSYTGGKEMLGRCLSMGLTPGSTVKMMENFDCGPVLAKVHNVEVALGRGLADKIIVARVNSK
jgi:DtxR family transcriptional regulator, Mn-dependent transcriptional regulator